MKKVSAFALALMLSMLVASQGAFAATLATTGVVVGDYVTLAVALLASAVAVIVGSIFAFMAVRKGIKWARSFA